MPDAGLEPACLAATALEAAASADSANRALVVWGAWSGSNRRPPGSHSGALPLRHTHHRNWSPRRGSNSRPHAPKARALPTALRGDKTGSRGWTRSSDLSLIKRVLFRLSYATIRNGSPTWDRTKDLRINSAALLPSELSGNERIQHSPLSRTRCARSSSASWRVVRRASRCRRVAALATRRTIASTTLLRGRGARAELTLERMRASCADVDERMAPRDRFERRPAA